MSLEDLFISVCDKCEKDIFGAAVHEDSLSFHEACFVCDHNSTVQSHTGSPCGARLNEGEYFSVGGERFCRTCYERDLAAVCYKCACKIIGCKRVDLPNSGRFFHKDCFKCVDCWTEIGLDNEYTIVPSDSRNEERESVEDDEYICRSCFCCRFPQRLCYQCEELIAGGHTVQDADGHFHHLECFVCWRCQIPLGQSTQSRDDGESTSGAYVEYGGNFYCPQCYNGNLIPGCALCSLSIEADGAQIMYKDEIFCERCFRCSKCNTDLSRSEFLDTSDTFDGETLEIECAEKDEEGNCLS
ncbi:four and a half LIM domains protein 3-like [Symsagittifera roscoffensis]|uniref:four and a half LIM domains protein 3-like n=1 Tax=Symsagittifera roscoffensis TaxID=84072 RepID=UPI00307C6427